MSKSDISNGMDENETKNFSTKLLGGGYEIIKFVIISLLIVVPFRMWVAQPFIVSGASMEPNFQNGDYLIIDEVSYNLREPERGEVIVLRMPGNASFFIKRIIGLPNEKIEIREKKIYIFNAESSTGFTLKEKYLAQIATFPDETVILKSDEYFVMGDNRSQSLDSRAWGAIRKNNIVGKTLVRLWPLAAIGLTK